jgi:hypothetical protein
LRGVEAELDGGLEGGQPEVGEEVADLLLAGVDDLTGRGEVDSGGHVLTKLLEAAAQLSQQGVGREARFRGRGMFRGHGYSCSASDHRAAPPRPGFSLKVGAPERFATPLRGMGRGKVIDSADEAGKII